MAVRAAHFEGDSKPLDMDITLVGIALDGVSLGAKASRLSGLRGSPAWFVAECGFSNSWSLTRLRLKKSEVLSLSVKSSHSLRCDIQTDAATGFSFGAFHTESVT